MSIETRPRHGLGRVKMQTFTDLLTQKFFFVLFPSHLDTVAWFASIGSILLGSFVGDIFIMSLLRIIVAEPFRVLL
jgi:hypothetical protein